MSGDLTLVGTTHPIAFDVAVDADGMLRGAAVVKQTDWGMKPYSALFGALKVADEVEVAIDASTRSADPLRVDRGARPVALRRATEAAPRAGPRSRAYRASSGRCSSSATSSSGWSRSGCPSRSP